MVIDLSFLRTFTKGNEEKIRRYIKLYLEDAPETINRMRSNIADKNWADLAINAHSLKPKTDFMGISTLKEILIRIEDSVRQGEQEQLKTLFDQAHEINQRACEALEKEIA